MSKQNEREVWECQAVLAKSGKVVSIEEAEKVLALLQNLVEVDIEIFEQQIKTKQNEFKKNSSTIL